MVLWENKKSLLNGVERWDPNREENLILRSWIDLREKFKALTSI